MKNSAVKTLPFSEKDVDSNNLTISLLQLLSLHHCISEVLQKQIKADLEGIFIEFAGQFTKRESSTLPVKAADKIYQSILYQADVYLRSINSIYTAVQILCSTPMKIIVQKGQSLILQYYKEIQIIFKKVYATKLTVPIYEYQNVILKVFDEFYRHYDARFDATNIPASIDYPLLHGNWMEEKGILYTKAYYTGIMLENEFCNLFQEKDVLWVLKMYGQKYQCHYTDLLFNIAEILLINLIAGSLLEKEKFTLRLDESDCNELQSKYALSSKAEIDRAVNHTFEPYCKRIENPQLVLYLQKYLQTFSVDFLSRVHSKNLKGYLCFDILNL